MKGAEATSKETTPMGDDIYLEWGDGIMERRARYASIEEAAEQARHDLDLGLAVHRIAGPDQDDTPGSGKTLMTLAKIKESGR